LNILPKHMKKASQLEKIFTGDISKAHCKLGFIHLHFTATS